jgi:uncharacterized protein YbjQ (UPF0145 family)
MSGDDEFEEKTDLTRIEDLSEFLHQNDPDIDAQLDSSDKKSDDQEPAFEELPSLDDLDDSEEEDVPAFDMSEENEDTQEFEDSESEEDTASFDSDNDEFPAFDSENESNFDDNSDNDSFDLSEDESFSMEEDNEVEEFSTSEEDNDSDDFSLSEETNEEEDDTFESDSFESSDDSENSEDDTEEEQSFNSEDTFGEFSESVSEDIEEDTIESSPIEEDNSFDESPIEQEVVEQIETPAPNPAPAPKHVDRSEKFDDVKKFAKNITYGKIAVGGNPAYSIILRNIKFEEDAEDITIILNEHGLVDQVGEDSIKQSLETGSLLISQISEYAAIYLTHKFRRFDLDIQMGLSDELHPSKSYERDSVGLISKSRMNQNKSETTRLEDSKVDIESIILSTTPTLENYRIIEYLGIVTEFVVINQDQLVADSELSVLHEREAKGHLDSENEQEVLDDEIELSHNSIYKDLSEKLRPLCMKKSANAVIGINYQITPLSNGENYKVSCSGSAVWVIDNN